MKVKTIAQNECANSVQSYFQRSSHKKMQC